MTRPIAATEVGQILRAAQTLQFSASNRHRTLEACADASACIDMRILIRYRGCHSYGAQQECALLKLAEIHIMHCTWHTLFNVL